MMKKLAELTDEALLGTPAVARSAPKYKVRVILRRADGLYALMHEARTGLYAFPGGGMEPGETPLDALRREILEETGCTCDTVQELGSIYENRGHCNLEQYTYFYTATCQHTPRPVTFTDEERAVGTSLHWCTLKEVAARIRQGQPRTDQQRFLKARDMAALDAYLNAIRDDEEG